jgi:hypothetical protein
MENNTIDKSTNRSTLVSGSFWAAAECAYSFSQLLTRPGPPNRKELMRKIGTPVTIRVDEATLAIARKRALALNKPLRSLLREIIEDVLKETQ